MTITRMDRGTIEDWKNIVQATKEWQSQMPQRIRAMLLQLKEQTNGHAINQLDHGLQTEF